MDFRWLQDFLTLAEAGNFRAAADFRHSSQPAFSRRIQSLEAWLGVELIDRSRYPTVLTPAGEKFRKDAADMVRKMIDSRAELKGEPTSGVEQITFTLPHTLAIARFPRWWKDWQDGSGCASCRLLATNVHDSVTSFVAGFADVLICFHHAQQPIYLEAGRYDRVLLATEWLKPYSAARRGQPAYKLPGTLKAPVSVLTYSTGGFLGRMVDLIVQSSDEKLHLIPAFESDLADAVLGMTVAGHGMAWLPECTAEAAVRAGQLRLAGDDRWSLPITVYAYRDLAQTRPVVNKLFAHLESRAQRQSTGERNNAHLADTADLPPL